MKSILTRINIDAYILLLVGTVALASVVPARGLGATIAGVCANVGIVLLFFLHGARLSRQAVIDGVRHWRLHAAVATMTYVLFPILGLGIRALPFLDPSLAAGFLFLTLLPFMAGHLLRPWIEGGSRDRGSLLRPLTADCGRRKFTSSCS